MGSSVIWECGEVEPFWSAVWMVEIDDLTNWQCKSSAVLPLITKDIGRLTCLKNLNVHKCSRHSYLPSKTG